MTSPVLPASPNWYCSRVSDCWKDGTFIYGARGCIYVYDISSKPPTFVDNFLAHSEKVSSVSLKRFSSASHCFCCSAGDDGKVKVWDLKNRNTLLKEQAHSRGRLTVTEWSPVTEDLIVFGDDKGHVLSWHITTGHVKYYKPENAVIFCLANSLHEAGVVAVGYKTGLILVLDISEQGTILHRLRGHEDEVHSVTWSPLTESDWFKLDGDAEDTPESGEGYLLASGSRDRCIRLWSTSKGRCLQTAKIPSNTGQSRPRYDNMSRSRLWLTLVWTSQGGQLVSSSNSGELLLWDFKKEGKQKWQTFNQYKSHTRIVFNISLGGPHLDTLCTISMDRQIGVWSLDSLVCDHLIPSLGGFAYCIAISSFHPDKLAIGVGDDMIRLWDVSDFDRPYEAETIWQGIKGKVTCLCWHPTNESILAYGTEDGKVGVHDVMSSKAPLISSTYHKKTVYVVTWGPLLPDNKPTHFAVYSCGDGNILLHNIKKMDKEAKNFQDFLPEKHKETTKVRSEICWKPDFTVVAIGNSDGSVEIYTASERTLLCVVQVHKKLINCVRWHPQYTVTSTIQSANHCWLALGSNELTVDVVDLSHVLQSPKQDDQEPTIIMNSYITLEGHHNRVTCLSWSPHSEGQLASASYDSSVQVWDVTNKKPVANYRGHRGRVLGVQWSLTDRDLVYSSGDDFTVRSWKVSQQEHVLPKKERHKKNRGHSKFKQTSAPSVEKKVDQPPMDFADELEELKKILEAKKQKLLTNQEKPVESYSTETSESIPQPDSQVAKSSNEAEETSHQDISQADKLAIVSSIVGFDAHQYSKATPVTEVSMNQSPEVKTVTVSDFKKQGRSKKRKDWKSLFPVTGTLENCGKVQSHQDAEMLASLVYGYKDCPEDAVHLGLFHNRRAVYKLFQAEIDHHISHGYIDGAIYLNLWKGNIGGASSIAAEHKNLSDWVVAMTAQACHPSYEEICSQFSSQLEADGLYHKAASYLIACHRVYDAIRLLQRNGLHRESVAISKVRLHQDDPLLNELYMTWAGQLVRDGGYELAAKCYIAAKQPLEAAKLLSRRGDESGLKATMFICLSADEIQEAKRLTLTFMFERMSKLNFADSELWTLLRAKLDDFNLKYFNIIIKVFHTLYSQTRDYLLSTEATPFDSEEHSYNQPDSQGAASACRSLKGLYNVLGLSQLSSEQVDAAIREISSYKPVQQGLMETGQLLVHVSFHLSLGLLQLSQGDQQECLVNLVSACDICYQSSQLQLLTSLCGQWFPEGADSSINTLQMSILSSRSCDQDVIPIASNMCEKFHSIQSLDGYINYCKLLRLNEISHKKTKSSGQLTVSEVRQCWEAILLNAGATCSCDTCKLDDVLRSENQSLNKMENKKTGSFPRADECAMRIVQLCEQQHVTELVDSIESFTKFRDEVIDWALKHVSSTESVKFFQSRRNKQNSSSNDTQSAKDADALHDDETPTLNNKENGFSNSDKTVLGDGMNGASVTIEINSKNECLELSAYGVAPSDVNGFNERPNAEGSGTIRVADQPNAPSV